MIRMKNLNKTIHIAIISSALILGCKKDQNTDDASAASNEVTFMVAEKSFSDDIEHITKSGFIDTNCAGEGFLASCVTVTDSGEDEYPRTIILDYGDGCVGPGGNMRSGTIHITLTNDMSEIGATRTVTFQDFAFNSKQLSGNRITTRVANTTDGEPQFTRSVDMTITHINTIERHFTENIVWTSGYDTEACGDNVFTITGSGYIVRPSGAVVNRTISIPLVRDFICGYTVSGVVTIDAPNGVRIIDFGNGTCDDEATVIFNGTSTTITLH
ncbi:MAG: hypothetical protein GC193_06860 [Cryomorphaceae bacterium]|nr:hypothetical protein [Cryomorphaceae bacterium]